MPTLKLLEQYGVSSYQQKRKAYVYHKGKYLPFPFQLHLAFLDPEEKILCYRDFMKAQQRNSKQYPQNLDQLLKTSFGETLYQNFLKPYNKKIWKTDLTQISTNWKGRITKESIATFKEGYLHKNTENYGSNAWVYYPRQ
ncbi:MAG: hypothetical protein LBG52_02395 [Candidatus Peribacteria bacterium]|jgi:protoporphyrinogen oxidase|nr:hypothetical protein [Candidatus Peribacteria bacterium]